MKSHDIQHKMNNMLFPLQEYFAITIWDTVRKSLRPRFAPPSPTEKLSTSLHTIYKEYLLKPNPAPNTDRMCPFSRSYHLFAWKWRHVVLFGCLLPWGDVLAECVVLNRARWTNKGWNPGAVKGRPSIILRNFPLPHSETLSWSNNLQFCRRNVHTAGTKICLLSQFRFIICCDKASEINTVMEILDK